MSTLDQARALFARQAELYQPRQQPRERGPKLRQALALLASGETVAEACRAVGIKRDSINGLIRSDRMFAALYEAARGLAELERLAAWQRTDERLAAFHQELVAAQQRREEDQRRLLSMIEQMLGDVRR